MRIFVNTTHSIVGWDKKRDSIVGWDKKGFYSWMGLYGLYVIWDCKHPQTSDWDGHIKHEILCVWIMLLYESNMIALSMRNICGMSHKSDIYFAVCH